MFLPIYLAMTPAQTQNCSPLPENYGFMACHFSPLGQGLSNLPAQIPPESIIILDDSIPYSGHDSRLICQTLEALQEAHKPKGILLDFQRPDNPSVKELIGNICDRLSCVVAVSDVYAKGLDCTVFLPPVPLRQNVETYLKPWQGTQIWLEVAAQTEVITINKQNVHISENDTLYVDCPLEDHSLLCHYSIQTCADNICFHIRRTKQDIHALTQKAASLGVTCFVGLYQELQQFYLST